ncbi:MAG TPA: EAL domain-containing protein [Paucimonas sp.]|nr:EAL domain-containing protein [Paucimonas sp.]
MSFQSGGFLLFAEFNHCLEELKIFSPVMHRAMSFDYRLLFHASPAPCLVVDADLIVVDVNRKYLETMSREREAVIGRHVRDALLVDGDHPDSGLLRLCESLERVLASREPDAIVLECRPRDGDGAPLSRCWNVIGTPLFEQDGTLAGVVAQGHDISEQKRVEAELRLNNERWDFVIQGSGDAYWDWDVENNMLVLSKRWHDMLGLEDGDVADELAEAKKRLHADDRSMVSEQISACLRGASETFSCEYRLQAKDGGWKWVFARGKVVSRGANGRAHRMTGTITDITEKKRSEEQIWRQANFDVLTGLPNRALFRDRLSQEVSKAERSGEPLALLFIDLDRFKEANDLLGHDVGDVLLMRAAERISASVRASDTVARLGGDEFTVILPEAENATAVDHVAEKILETLSKPFCLGDEMIYLSASIGITLYPTDAADPEGLIRNADQAMYAAKRSGRNQYSYFTATLQERARSRLRLIAELREALAANQFRVHFQPIIDLREGRIAKAEALLRWCHPVHGVYYPSEFIGVAEETGLINEIGNWVFMESAWWSQRWSRQLGAPFQISVNASPVQFHAGEEGVDWVKHLNDLGLSRNCISVEITEGMLLNASDDVSSRLLEYRDAGIQVALDDFGTGYSSMSYLKKFDIDYLKIDQSFVRDMSHNQGSRTIAETMIMMAHKLGMRVIAEGIETSEQRELLARAGCDYGQGFLFSRAVAPQELEALLQRNSVAA